MYGFIMSTRQSCTVIAILDLDGRIDYLKVSVAVTNHLRGKKCNLREKDLVALRISEDGAGEGFVSWIQKVDAVPSAVLLRRAIDARTMVAERHAS